MRTLVCLCAWLFATGCQSPSDGGGHADRDSAPTLTLERILSGPSLTGNPPSAPTWSPDSSTLAFTWSYRAGSIREIWVVDADGTGLRRLTPETGTRSSVRDVTWMPDGQGLAYLRANGLWLTDLSGNTARIAELGAGASDLSIAPNGRYASVRRDGDLWLVDLSDGKVRRLTHVGVPSISKVPVGRYRRREVEIGSYVWGGPTYAWSPDSRTIAVHHVDRRNVRKVPFPHYLGKETDPNLVRRGYPGDENERRSVGLVDVDTGKLELLDLPDATGTRIVDFSWSRDGRLLLDRESDTAVDRWLHILEPATGKLTQLWHDRRETRVYTSIGSAWHPNGEDVIMLSDLGDRYGLYALSVAAPTPRLLTNPAFDVTGPPSSPRTAPSSIRRTSRVLTNSTCSEPTSTAAGRPRSPGIRERHARTRPPTG